MNDSKGKKVYSAMKISKLGSLDELTQLSLGKSGSMTDGRNAVGKMMKLS